MYTDIFQYFDVQPSIHPHESLRRSIEALLNTREGNVAYPSRYGMPDVIDSTVPHYAEKLKKTVMARIQAYEPRIKRIHCQYASEHASLSATRYELLLILSNGETLSVTIEMTGAGCFHVRC